MFGKVLSCGMVVAMLGAAPAFADLSGPAELPPSSYKGQQYVDSRGCTFLRAGYGGQVTWVPRVSRDRKQMCDTPPPGRSVAAPETAPKVAAEPAPVAAAPAPKAKVAPKVAVAAAPAAPEVIRPVTVTETAATGGLTVVAEGRSAKYTEFQPPAGYKLAWDDDRLNPNRGKQTVEGFLAMDQIWTRTTPAELREDSDVKRKPVTIIVRGSNGEETRHDGYVLSSKGGQRVVQIAGTDQILVTKSSKAVAPEVVAPKAAKAAKAAKAPVESSGRFLVQVGTFGMKSNVEGAAGRLKGLGLPVARGKLSGGALTVVYAGPFASAAEAKQALSAARGLGFGDARIVQ